MNYAGGKTVRPYLLAGGLLLLIFGSITAYLGNRFYTLANTDFTPPPVTIAAAHAKEEIWEQYLEAVGTIRAARGADLSAETSGEITSINFESGDYVEAGRELVVLNDEVEQASRLSQVAALELAEILFERDSQLIEQKSIPQSQFDRSRADLHQARAMLAETEARIRHKRIDAPFSGTIGIRLVKVGDYLSTGTAIATLQDLSEMEIDFSLPGLAVPQLRSGLDIEVRVGAFPDDIFEARIIAIDSRIDAATRSILVRAKLQQTAVLLPGMFAKLRVFREELLPTVTVPETAVTYSLHGDTVFRLRKTDNNLLNAEPVIVEVGQVREGRIAILKGISAGDQVVSAGQNKLYRGARVVIDEQVEM
jgi:membrane fusion protein (multidrug efflux system)